MFGSSGRNPHRILVLGAGVSGLTTALELARRGHVPTVLAERFAPRVTSVVAGALWEWPPAVCGHQRDPDALARAKKWTAESHGVFETLAADRSWGVHLRPVTFYFRRPLAEQPEQLRKMRELRETVRGFRHDPALIDEAGIDTRLGLRDAYEHMAPMVDTDVYLRRLIESLREVGCHFVERRIEGALADREAALLSEFGASGIVNCTGLGSRELARDEMFPLRGALVRVRNEGRAMPRITRGHCVAHGETDDDHGFVFILPRGDDRLLLGGLAEPHEWDTGIGLGDYAPVAEMYRRCVEFLPVLRHAEIDDAEPVRVGLRPFRPADVRVEREPGRSIVHNYGHGGSGVTLSWGCAREAASLVESLLATA